MKSHKIASLAAAVTLSICLSAGAQAQHTLDSHNRLDGESVRLKQSAQGAADPIRTGGLEIRPEIVFSAGTSSNVLARQSDEISDNYLGFEPVISLRSDWARHALNGEARIQHLEYSELTSEGRTSLEIGLRGRLDTGEKSNLAFGVNIEDKAEDRRDLSGIPDSVEPNDYTRIGGRLGAARTFNRLKIEVDVEASSYDYDDAELESGLIQDQDFRDRDELQASLKSAYSVRKNAAIYTKLTHLNSDYSAPNIFNAFNRDYAGTVVLLGTDFSAGKRVRGDIGLGYQRYTYDEPSFESIEDIAVSGQVDWFVNDHTLLVATANRGVIDPGVIETNAAIESGAGLHLEHKLTPRFSINSEARVSQFDFENIDRTDDRIDFKIGGSWKLNPNLWIEGGYELADQSSDFQEFSDNRVLLKMRVFP